MVFPNYSSTPFVPGSEMGNMMAFMQPEMLIANNANRKKLIEQRSKQRNSTEERVVTEPVNKAVDKTKDQYSPSLFDRVIGGFKMGAQGYGNVFQGRPVYTGVDEIREDMEKGIVRDSEGEILYEGGEKVVPKDDEDKYLKQNKELLKDIARLGEEARGRDFVREGIRTLANAPLIGAQAQLAAAEGINRLTIGNMGAMAAQNRVLEANPSKQKIAGRYFR